MFERGLFRTGTQTCATWSSRRSQGSRIAVGHAIDIKNRQHDENERKVKRDRNGIVTRFIGMASVVFQGLGEREKEPKPNEERLPTRKHQIT